LSHDDAGAQTLRQQGLDLLAKDMDPAAAQQQWANWDLAPF
jgi:hypothetical protein